MLKYVLYIYLIITILLCYSNLSNLHHTKTLHVLINFSSVQKSLEQNIDQCTKLKADYDDFIPLAKTDVEEYLAAFKAGGSDIDVYETEVERLYKV